MNCSSCGSVFEQRGGPQHVYCSQVCKKRARWRRQEVTRTARRKAERAALLAMAASKPSPPPRVIECPSCGDEFEARSKHHAFCCQDCRRGVVRYAATREVRTCESCGAETLGSRRKWRCALGCSPARSAYLDSRPVYFIQAGPDGPIKIGVSHDVAARLVNLQTAHWEELRLLGTAIGGFELERDLHAAFAAHRLKGEWFAISPTELPLAS